MPPRKSTKNSTMYKSTVNVLTTKRRFEGDLTQNVYDAWSNRASERYLYAVYSHILSNLCSTIEPVDFPDTTLSFSPQAVFGTLKPPEGDSPGVDVNKKRLYKAQIPDYVRVMISRNVPKRKTVRHLVDLWEIKELNGTNAYWSSAEARAVAKRVTLNNVEQVYHQAMSAFAHNSKWKTVHALLIVGVYFSQFVWKRPASKFRRPLSPLPSLSGLTPEQALELIKRIKARIEHYKIRPLPEIEYFNAPVLLFDDDDDGPGGRVSLSPQFLYAVRLPLKSLNFEISFQPSWFSSSGQKPSPSTAVFEVDRERVEWMLRGIHIQRLRTQMDIINSPATTASNPSGYKPHYRLKKAAEQLSPLANKGERLRNLTQNIQMIAGAGSGDDDDSESEEEESEDGSESEKGSESGNEVGSGSDDDWANDGEDDEDELEYVDEPSIYVEDGEK